MQIRIIQEYMLGLFFLDGYSVFSLNFCPCPALPPRSRIAFSAPPSSLFLCISTHRSSVFSIVLPALYPISPHVFCHLLLSLAEGENMAFF